MRKFVIGSTFISAVFSLSCHQCAGTDTVGSLLQSALSNYNISTGTTSGDCSSKTGSNMCSNSLCQKSIVAYKMSYSGISYTYHTYVKSCVSNSTQKVGECTQTSSEAIGGYTKISSICLCNNKDFCNAASFLDFGFILIFLCTILHLQIL